MPLETGLYIIRSKIDDREVGRYPIEDRSLGPKPLFALREPIHRPTLFVKGNEEGYIIEASHNPTASFNGDVYAILLSQPPAERWIITEQPQHGRDVYTIETNDRRTGWVVSDREDDYRGYHINVRPLRSTKSLPPRFTPDELFEFVRVDGH